jgi:hypothetical protein
MENINLEKDNKAKFMSENNIPENFGYLVFEKDGIFSFNEEEYFKLRNEALKEDADERGHQYHIGNTVKNPSSINPPKNNKKYIYNHRRNNPPDLFNPYK